ncbi:MAG: hypothetical protein KXJ61_10955 [Hydrogenophaga sp.]|jgi:hypothetical protein|uniref:hypothetical protein n=1 Tax=Hydrogenophaga sp. TaxID=1904254 RepID=UPI001E1828D8|nr:hypothetical protein [Hydrogenophaga sp.]MBW0170733.1 hypothetical protein [Hydrogenophaga sp.]MBW0185589.1 hypothetical protein [Hydrogenophaga sp.]
MKRINAAGKLEEMQPFDDAPDDFALFIRDRWLPRIQKDEQVAPTQRIPAFHTRGHSLVPHLESDAITALAEVFPDLPQLPEIDRATRAAALDAPDPSSRFPRQKPPTAADTYEHAFIRWRDVWAREAYFHAGRPMGHTRKQAAALNILTTASELRAAIETGAAEKAAALGMVLAFEAIAGGYMLDVETKIEAGAVLQKAKDSAFKNGVGKTQPDMQKARAACIKWAAEAWKASPTTRMKTMSEALEKKLYELMGELKTLDLPPKANTIRTWLKEAAAAGELSIPPAAQKPGADPKKK